MQIIQLLNPQEGDSKSSRQDGEAIAFKMNVINRKQN